MTKKTVFAALAERLQRNKKLEIAVYAMLALLAVIIFFSSKNAHKDNSGRDNAVGSEAASQSFQDEASVETRLKSILSKIDGVGAIDVMVTYDTTSELVPAMDTDISTSADSSSQRSYPVTVSGGGEENPVVLKQVQPKIRGVIVVAQGAENIAVKVKLIAAVSTVLGISQECVDVFSMSGNQ